MPDTKSDVSLHEVVYEVVPNLNMAEKLVNNTLESIMEAATDPLEIMRRKEQQDAFRLEVRLVRMHLEHVLTRHREDVAALVSTDGREGASMVKLDRNEAQALRSAIDIYQHVRAYQRGERRHPLASR
ncbi:MULTISPECIES: hypothetical protein [Halomonadaceae]|jgi:hypothetical protein|uniref:Uncharacterized protein n=1 Tax=Vreelandella janggokensis TaxID=370767 RepID=A0ABT4IX80_9GAMM|nr:MULTISPECIES: hypothetical protein [Halomonas]MCW4151412.1 hypothetical protein [Halomonas sp. 18H]MCZ0928251.1 hypothetical protein [Halomonas janggokensis]MDR5887082.1 hypothetical protein [Halomonas janggokensis]